MRFQSYFYGEGLYSAIVAIVSLHIIQENDLIIYGNQTFYEMDFVKYCIVYKWKCVYKKCKAKIQYVKENLTEILKYDIITIKPTQTNLLKLKRYIFQS